MKRYLISLCMLLLPSLLLAQGSTTASISGIVKDASGETLPGANVVAIHQPTGSQYGTTTRSDGRYTLKNLRVGGPYRIEVSFVGYKKSIKQGINLELGQDLTLNVTLESGNYQLEEVTVLGEKSPILNSDRTGARTNISRQEIDRAPTISRSLSDFTRLSPLVTSGNSFGGANNRYNNVLVDGATLNDVFGLGEAVPGSQAGVTSPISIDAIQEFNVDIAPFDVTNSGFTGGQVNAITRSGTNKFSGSAYYQLRNENFVGDYKLDNGNTADSYPQFKEHYLGLRVGGPIIKDKLFFFLNVEAKRREDPLTTGILNSNAANIYPVSGATLDNIRQIAQNTYGYDPGGYDLLTMNQDNNKILAKIDWNINQEHKFTFRYNLVDATDESGIGRSVDSYSLSNRQYDFNSQQNSFVAQLKSTFSNRLYNEARLVYTRIRDSRDVVAQPFPEVNVSLYADGDYRDLYMGIDRFSQANSLGQDLFELTDNVTLLMNNHEFTFGTNNQLFHFNNLFVQDAFGTYEFRSIGDFGTPSYVSPEEAFQQGIPYSYNYSYLLPGGKPRAKFDGIQLGFYVQDKWTVTDYLKLTFGMRMDIPILPQKPTYNPYVPSAYPGYTTDRVASGNPLWSPRFGFNWDVSQGERTTQVRGGIGLFAGNPPFVWISNQYSNTGADYGRVDLNKYNGLPQDPGFFSPDPNNQPSPLDPNSSLASVNTSEVNLISKDFKYPQTMKVNLAVDQELPWGLTGTIEGVYSKMVNDVTFTNLNLGKTGESAYGRPLYGDIYFNSRYGTASGSPNRLNGNFTNAILLKNTNDGYQYSLTAQLQKRTAWGLSGSVSYTYNRARNVNNGTSSRAISNWQYNENFDVNNPGLGTADFERRHRLLANVSYRIEYAKRFATTISLVYDGRSGTPFSWIYNGDANGDGRYDNDLVYVPANESDVVLTSGNWDELNSFINDESDLKDARGGVVNRNTAREPWTNYLDLRINQEIMTVRGQKLELTASLFNVLNFLNKDWGKRYYTSYNNYQAIKFEQYVDSDFIANNPQYNLTSSDIGKPVINFDQTFNGQNYNELGSRKDMFRTSDLGSRWQMQLGLRYSF